MVQTHSVKLYDRGEANDSVDDMIGGRVVDKSSEGVVSCVIIQNKDTLSCFPQENTLKSKKGRN